MVDLRILVEGDVDRPSATFMDKAYQDYHKDSRPCKDPATCYQCAVRMSIALGRCGFGLESFSPRVRVHWHRHACRLSIPHAIGARELGLFLRERLLTYETFMKENRFSAAQKIRDQKGIIYFNNCFFRTLKDGNGGKKKETTKKGCHIDFWNGRQYYNEILEIGAGSPTDKDPSLFTAADEVWFFGLQ